VITLLFPHLQSVVAAPFQGAVAKDAGEVVAAAEEEVEEETEPPGERQQFLVGTQMA
jgi:hypothetical protein